MDITITQVNSALHSSGSLNRVPASAEVNAGEVCDPIWHVISRTSMVISTTNYYIVIFTFLLLSCAAIYDGLTIDTEGQKLYYADAAKSGGKVGELSTDGTAHRVLFNGDRSSRPRAVVFDDDNRYSCCVVEFE